ncbi:MAG: 30S ribosomal protein S3 [Candidatus Komeilibacteria bacterium RIFCSPLOWO2_02_FULL_48_11]|uniref:Small ribosomal subunit protein uS3 n=1 Tax=Candidatus Komeilibacteria bacterium RIFCSPLOWO2_02_FULL_48_11 TaxID=1798553 RepID=A0A1G2BVL9_9BACT|nr:MAG: 30S ribosomal protein S3 [Candidatus Komeilibacteria bacterium RIFCSPLOWO2_02_FULL_48_11]
MGQKIHPTSYRLGVIYGWKSKWFSSESYSQFLREDTMLRSFIRKRLSEARVDDIEIERSGKGNDISIAIHTAKPGMVIGRGGAGIEDLKKEIEAKVLKNQKRVKIAIQEIRQGWLSSAVVAQGIASDLVRRIPFRRAAKQAIDQVQKAGAKGVKIRVTGRLNGAEIARKETFNWGSIPLHTLRANIDFAQAPAHTTYGVIGVSVWIYKGDVFERVTESAGAGGADMISEIKKVAHERAS